MTRTNGSCMLGRDPEAVLRAIVDRGERLRAGGPREDGQKLGLVLEGGGMRATAPAGALVELGARGYTDAFDHVYATSAGAMNAAYFLSRQTPMGISIYHEDLASRRFVNPWRVWKIMDIDWVFSHVVTRAKPLDTQALLAAISSFHVAATTYHTGERRMVDIKRPGELMLRSLKACLSIPLLYNRTVVIDGEPLYDGGLLNPFPIEDAIADGCTHVLVLLSQEQGYVKEPIGRTGSFLFDQLFARGAEHLVGQFARYPEVDRRCRDIAAGRVDTGHSTRIATVYPSGAEPIHRSTIDHERLGRASQDFAEQMAALLDSV